MLKKKFSHSLQVAEIVLKQDETASEATDNYVANVVGKYFPLIKIRNVLIDFAKIDHFDLSIGNYLLPQFSCTVLDEDLSLLETTTAETGEVVTFFIGNAKDTYHTPIKNDYYVLPNSTQDGYYSVSGILHVPNLYNKPNRVFQEKTSVEVLEEIAKECNLGFVTNLESTNDRMDWIQHQSNHDFILYVESKSYVDDNTKIKVFVDQYANLNVIDIKKAIDSAATTMMSTDISTGEKLENDVLLEATNYLMNPEDRKAVYQSYNVSSDYGQISRNFPNEMKIISLNTSTLAEHEKSIKSTYESHLEKISTYSNFSNDNAYEAYFQSSMRNMYNELLTKGKKINLNFQIFIPSLHLYMTLPNTIYNFEKFTSYQDQNKNIGLNDEPQKVQPNEPNPGDHINENLSGDVLVTSMTISYNRNNFDEYNAIKQSINTFLKKSTVIREESQQNTNNQQTQNTQTTVTTTTETTQPQPEPETQQPTSSEQFVYYTNDGEFLGGDLNSLKIYITTKSEYNGAKQSNNWSSINVESKLLKDKGKAITHNTFINHAATIYGESSAFRVGMEQELLDEMTAIAFVHKVNKIAYGANSTQAKLYKQKKIEARNGTKMQYAPAAIIKSLTTNDDPSNGATMWDGIEQAQFPSSDNRFSTGSWEIHMNTMGWTIPNNLHQKWKKGVQRLNGTFKAPQEKYTPGKYPNNRYSTANTIALEAKAVYLGTIFWKELKVRKKKPNA